MKKTTNTMTATTKKWLTSTAKKIAELTDCNAHGEALAMGIYAFENLYRMRGMEEGGICNPFRLAGDFVEEINAEHNRAGFLPCPLFQLRYGIMQAVFETARQCFPQECAIIEKGF